VLSRIADDQSVVEATLKRVLGPSAHALDDVEKRLQQELRSEYPFVDELARYGCMLGGKRLRPALLLLTAEAVGQVTDDHLLLATVVEMVHTATLIHDDVLDEAELRRHLPTVNARWDDESSLLLGDFIFSRAFALASSLDTVMACRLIGQATHVICEGEIRQKGCRGDYSLSETTYLEILDAKTAELFACCCQLGAHFAGASDTVREHLGRYGRYLGIAFQIADDLLDVFGDESVAGKSLGSDLEKQKPTLPLIRTMQVASDEDQRQLMAAMEGPVEQRQRLLMPLFEKYGAIEYSREKARYFSEQALEELAGLKENAASDALRQLTKFVIQRVK
jgi:octaprenyl-diphosphate synthase